MEADLALCILRRDISISGGGAASPVSPLTPPISGCRSDAPVCSCAAEWLSTQM